MAFIGRISELEELNRLYKANQSKIAVIYGRRRVGKSALIEAFIADKPALEFEGLEGISTQGQIEQFIDDLSLQANDPILARAKIDKWNLVFDYLTKYFEQANKKHILFFDELQWLAANQTKLVSMIKKYWDKHWSKQNVLLILCGSVSSYMVNKVIKSKALYGRTSWELALQPLSLQESYKLLKEKRSYDEVMQYAMIFGGIPKYLNEIDTRLSLDQNLNKLCFTTNAILTNEYEKIFYSQFREYQTYEHIIDFLKSSPHSLAEISKRLGMHSGGGVKLYLDNLEKASFITSYTPYDRATDGKLKRYKLTDEYLRFYFKYIKPNLKLIQSNRSRDLFSQLVKPVWNAWLGFSFENFCMKNAMFLAEKMGFINYVSDFGPIFRREDTHFQVDLIFMRNDKVITLCEMKYIDAPITAKIIKEVEKKTQLIQLPRGYTLEKALISRFGPDETLKELEYFNHSLTVRDLFEN